MTTISSAKIYDLERHCEGLRKKLLRASLEFALVSKAQTDAERAARLSAIWADDLEVVAGFADDPWATMAKAELKRRRDEWVCSTCDGAGRFDDIECGACGGSGEKRS